MHWSRFCPPEMEMEMDHHPFGHLRSDKLTCRGGGGGGAPGGAFRSSLFLAVSIDRCILADVVAKLGLTFKRNTEFLHGLSSGNKSILNRIFHSRPVCNSVKRKHLSSGSKAQTSGRECKYFLKFPNKAPLT